MTDKKDLDIMAFPNAVPQQWATIQDGMSLRDWFAGQALAGMLADPNRDMYPEDYGVWAYKFAQGMLEERAKYEGGKTND